MKRNIDPNAACKWRPIKNRGDVFFKHFIRLIVDSFELTPETSLNDLCTY